MPGEPIPPGGIVSSNSHALAALVRAMGGEPAVLPVAKDTTEAIAAAADQVAGFDLLGFLRETGKFFTVNYMLQKESVSRRLP